MRLNKEQLNTIKQKFGVDKLWSYSRISTYLQCKWLYKLKYIDHIKVDSENVYTFFGTVAHDIIQGLYENKYEYKDMVDAYNNKVLEWQLQDNPKLKFTSENERDHYIENLRHYFTHTNTIPYDVVNEQPVLAVFNGNEKYVFQGYVDSQYRDEDDNLVILDYKTSSISGFTGKNLAEKSKQLFIYAIGINQFHNIPLEKIKIRYDMMKYCIVKFRLKNGNLKETKAERRIWVAKIANQIRKDLEDVPKQLEKLNKEYGKLEKKLNAKKQRNDEEKLAIKEKMTEIDTMAKQLSNYLYNPVEINDMIEEAINSNNLNNLPKFIQNKYSVENCYIDVELTQETADKIKSEITSVLNEIVAKSKEEDLDKAFERQEIDNSESYYCANLCDMRNECMFYKRYRENNTMFLDKKETMSDKEILAMLGL